MTIFVEQLVKGIKWQKLKLSLADILLYELEIFDFFL